MVINERNSLINSFTKGMNSDQTYDQLDNQSYVYAKNIRITKNEDINGSEFAPLHEGIVTPVLEGKYIGKEYIEGDIIAVNNIGNLLIIITFDGTKMYVYRYKIEDDQVVDFQTWWEWTPTGVLPKLLSTYVYKELEGVTKLYIATGIVSIITIRIDDGKRPFIDNQNKYFDVDYLINNRITPTNLVYINSKIDGKLKTSQIQYTYRYYNKFGISTRISPLSNKILVIDNNRNKEIGNAEDTETSIGFQLSITDTEVYKNIYDRMLIFRLQYIRPNEDAIVSIIYDGEITSLFNDVGNTSLKDMTIQEFSTLQGVILVPKIIQHNQEYFFASNVKDDTIIPNLKIKPLDNDEEYVIPAYTRVLLDSYEKSDFPTVTGLTQDDKTYLKNITIDVENSSRLVHGYSMLSYFSDKHINIDTVDLNYNDIFTSSLLRSLRRGETYDYGIVYYDKYGRRSDVIKLNQNGIQVPSSLTLYPKPIHKNLTKNMLFAVPIGVQIKLPQPYIDENTLAEDIIGCQIVRRSSKNIYQKTLLQVALARPVRQALCTTESFEGSDDIQLNYSPYYPTGFLTSNYMRVGAGYYTRPDTDTDEHKALGESDYFYNMPPGKYGWGAAAGSGVVVAMKPWYIYPTGKDMMSANSKNNHALFLIFSSEIDFRRDDVLSKLSSSSIKVNPVYAYLYRQVDMNAHINESFEINENLPNDSYIDVPSNYVGGKLVLGSKNKTDGLYYSYADETENRVPLSVFELSKNFFMGTSSDPITLNQLYSAKQRSKDSDSVAFKWYDYNNSVNNDEYEIKSIKDVKIPLWYEGFSNLQLNGRTLATGGIKQYKQFNTSIGSFVFNNWISSGLYDLRIVPDESQTNVSNMYIYQYLTPATISRKRQMPSYATPFIPDEVDEDSSYMWASPPAFIGAGGSCFLMEIDNDTHDVLSPVTENTLYNDPYNYYLNSSTMGTYICNIQHDINLADSEPDEFIQYFGFGNYFNLLPKYENGQLVSYSVWHKFSLSAEDYMYVFDGDIYITPHELTTQYKAYDFISTDTLQSILIVNYVPMESKVNTYFDYGMNYLNTQNKNLIIEAGSIEGVTSLDRPVHQYNMIYSANDESNDVFNLARTEDQDINEFKQRTYYSEAKTNGEYIDNFLIFKPDAFIDVDNKYGELTNLLTDKNVLYYWQDKAFGKFSVNERSLINDQNGNTIMLGQAGILSRNDYISTKYGMRPFDFSAISTETGVFWIDINNKAVVASTNNNVTNYGEVCNVLNIINRNISDNTPKIDYDLLNNELLCKMFNDDEQIVFNLKYNIATSIYNRDYDYITYVDNILFGLYIENGQVTVDRYNYINSGRSEFMTPLQLQFITNASASTTKVFDSQQLVPIKRPNVSTDTIDILDGMSLSFETDILGKNSNGVTKNISTDREGNVIYNIPRFGNEDYGNRMRGKWMKIDIDKNNPNEYFTISHAITKFRQSYS